MRASTPEPSDLKIFVVEDHADTLKALTTVLGRMGHEVVSATSIHEAEDEFPGSGCQMLLTDIELPDGTGWDLLPRLHPPTPFIAFAMSGRGADTDQARSLQAGFRAHLLKPFQFSDLQRLVALAQNELKLRAS